MHERYWDRWGYIILPRHALSSPAANVDSHSNWLLAELPAEKHAYYSKVTVLPPQANHDTIDAYYPEQMSFISNSSLTELFVFGAFGDFCSMTIAIFHRKTSVLFVQNVRSPWLSKVCLDPNIDLSGRRTVNLIFFNRVKIPDIAYQCGTHHTRFTSLFLPATLCGPWLLEEPLERQRATSSAGARASPLFSDRNSTITMAIFIS